MKPAPFRLIAILLGALPAFAGYYPEWVRTGKSASMDSRGVAVGDFNSDGRPDLIVRVADKSVQLLLTDTSAKPGAATTIYSADSLPSDVTGDADRDGKTDVVVADATASQLVFLHSKGDGTFDTPQRTSLNFVPGQIEAGDFDGDGKLDVAVRGKTSAILALYRGDGTGKFSESSRMNISATNYTMTIGDVDGDHRLDILVGRSDPQGFDLYYGKGNGSFENAVAFPAAHPSIRFLIADLDGDGDGEILSTQQDGNNITELVNLGSRSFASPATYLVEIGSPPGESRDLLAGDVNGDGGKEVVVAIYGISTFATLPVNADATLGSPRFGYASLPPDYMYPTQLVWGDFNLDGRMDIAFASQSSRGVAIVANASGDANVVVTSKYPVISLGDPITFSVSVDPAAGSRAVFENEPPFPTGTVTLDDGTTPLGVATPNNRVATFTIDSLATGTHELTAKYSGDDAWRSGNSASFTQKVVSEKTTTTLTASKTDFVFGESIQLNGVVATPLAGDTRSVFVPYIDGVAQETLTGPPVYWWVYPKIGTHTLYIRYEGTSSQPPSTSNVITLSVRKANSHVMFGTGYYGIDQYKPMKVHVHLDPVYPSTGTPGGWVRVYEGDQLLARAFGDNFGFSGGMSFDIALPAFQTAGKHRIHAVYEGDQHFEGATTDFETEINVTPASAPLPRRHVSGH